MHHAHDSDTLAFLTRGMPQFNGPKHWSPNSSDLNPVDCRVWGVMQERVYRMAIQDADDFKQCLIATWSGLQ